ncbi:hypothetical protein NMY22_g5195 [Coprinellus aureogranulatus]|nr:hypothetical protein NMY22_g5195 [Coprinellus aureogranulatus]
MGRSLSLLYLVLSSLIPRSFTQTSGASCLPYYSWTSNSQGRTPCQVASSLLAICNGGTFDVLPLADGQHYEGPTLVANANSAKPPCDGANGRRIAQMSRSANSLNRYRFGMSESPAWAYQDIRENSIDTLDQFLAKESANGTESSAVPTPTTTSADAGQTAAASAETTDPATSETPSADAESSVSGEEEEGPDLGNANRIGGSVVGSLLGAALIVGGVLLWMRRRRRRPAIPPELQGREERTGKLQSRNMPQPKLLQYNLSSFKFTPTGHRVEKNMNIHAKYLHLSRSNHLILDPYHGGCCVEAEAPHQLSYRIVCIGPFEKRPSFAFCLSLPGPSALTALGHPSNMASDQMATCSTAQWTFNSRNQSPCVVGSALAGACVGGDFTLTPLQPDFVYLGPSVAAATQCRCSTVYYSMLSACATCQGNNFIRWGRYSTNCTTVYSGVFPRDIPQNIAVPAWAYMDVVTSDTFNLTLAQNFGGVESTAPAQSTGSPSTRSSSSGTSTNTGGGPAATSGGSGTDPEKKSSNTGAIVGGVVGGIVGLALIAGLIFFLLRRRNKQKHLAPSALYGPQGTVSEKPPMNHFTGDGSVYSNGGGAPAPQIYDPNNPATFPTSDGSMPYTNTPPAGQPTNFNVPPSPGYAQNYNAQQANGNYMPVPPHMTGQSGHSGYSQPNTSITQPSGPRYTGAPEL